MLFIPLFVKSYTRHLVCPPIHLPAAMAHSDALAPAPSRLRIRLFPKLIPALGCLGVGAPSENLLLLNSLLTALNNSLPTSPETNFRLISVV